MKPDNTNNNGSSLENWLDTQDVSQRMRISGRTLARWRRQKTISFSRLGGKIYYREADILALLEKNIRHAKR